MKSLFSFITILMLILLSMTQGQTNQQAEAKLKEIQEFFQPKYAVTRAQIAALEASGQQSTGSPIKVDQLFTDLKGLVEGLGASFLIPIERRCAAKRLDRLVITINSLSMGSISANIDGIEQQNYDLGGQYSLTDEQPWIGLKDTLYGLEQLLTSSP